MALQTTTQIYIAGTQILSYVRLELVQEIDAHHDLELACRRDVIEKLSEDLIGDSKEYLGATVTVQISAGSKLEGYKELQFKGVITRIKGSKAASSSSGEIVTLYAKSASILCDDGGHYSSFNDTSLSEILEDTFRGYDTSRLETSFSPVFTEAIHYSVQHNQSAFSFASRLASYYNEWFYYDGKKLVFGSPSQDETILTSGIDLHNFSVELSSVPNSFGYSTNDYLTDELHQKSSSDVTIPSEGYHGFTNAKSKEIFSKETQVYHHLYNDPSLKRRLDTQVEQYTKARAMQQVIAKGSSDNPGVNLGEIVKIEGYGSYRVINIIHSNIEGGAYRNHFVAVEASFDTYPKMNINNFPKSEIQIAKVMENNDPDGLSRIRVQFSWQKPLGEMTPWLRMMTPHAGSDKGFHFIPEVGEEVVVNFEGGNAERPFVAGTLYHGSASANSWQSNANDIKAIKTRSGHLIELIDSKGAESITITDKNRNVININTASNDITISAGENMTFNAKNMQINVEENLDVSVGKNKSEMITGDYFVSATNEDRQVGETIKVISSEFKQEAQEITTDASGEIKTNAGGKITIASAETVEYGE